MMKLQGNYPTILIVVVLIVPFTLYLHNSYLQFSNEQSNRLTKVQDELASVLKVQERLLLTIEKLNAQQPSQGTALVQTPSTQVTTGSDVAKIQALAKCVTTKGAKQKACWREAKRDMWIQTLDQIKAMPVSQLPKFNNPLHGWEGFDLITITHECDYNYLTRVGADGDGGKWICGPLAVDNSCVLFSLGSFGDFDFERSMQKFTNGKCKMYTFDCTGSWSDPSTTFYPWCIADRDYTDTNGRIYKRVATIFDELKLTQINHLKMDIEGYEWQVFKDIMSTQNKLALPKQISFELHFVGSPEGGSNWANQLVDLLKTIDAAGYRFAAIEDNTRCDQCAEFVIIRE